MSSIRDQRQEELSEQWIKSGKWGIILAAPRMGKCFVAINILETLNPHCTILLTYPDTKIKNSWEEDFKKRNYDNPNVTFVTHVSLKKYVDKIFDIIIIDEIHLLSPAQIEICKELFKTHHVVLGLTGTLSSWTKKDLLTELHLPVVATYTIAQAISEGVIADYDITVIKVPLDRTTLQVYKKKRKTEKAQFDYLTWLINKLDRDGKATMFLRLARMRIIQNSLAKRIATINLLSHHLEDRILIFCGTTAIADNLHIPSYHSKSTEKKIFQDFVNGKGNHLAVCKIGNTGVTYKPLNSVIINYFDSNSENMVQKIMRCLSFEYDNPDKKAHIYIVSTNELVEQQWLSKALIDLDKTKIKYL